MSQRWALNYGVIKVKKRSGLRLNAHYIIVSYESKIALQNQVNVALTKLEFVSVKSQSIKVTLTQVNP